MSSIQRMFRGHVWCKASIFINLIIYLAQVASSA